MAQSKPSTNSRLSVDDWLQAGFAILAEEGITALKIDRLCHRLGATKGSFYWHFTDIARYRAALVEAWGELRDDDRRHFSELAALPPRERLSEMMSSLVSARQWTLERAMREWARTDADAAASVRAADQRVLAAVRQAFVDYGFDPDEADLRADATFAAGVAFCTSAAHSLASTPRPAAKASSKSCSPADGRPRNCREIAILRSITIWLSFGGHVVFDYDTSRELAAALTLGMKVSRTAMV